MAAAKTIKEKPKSLKFSEDPELSEEAEKQLQEARKTPLSKYVSHKKMEKEFLRRRIQ